MRPGTQFGPGRRPIEVGTTIPTGAARGADISSSPDASASHAFGWLLSIQHRTKVKRVGDETCHWSRTVRWRDSKRSGRINKLHPSRGSRPCPIAPDALRNAVESQEEKGEFFAIVLRVPTKGILTRIKLFSGLLAVNSPLKNRLCILGKPIFPHLVRGHYGEIISNPHKRVLSLEF